LLDVSLFDGVVVFLLHNVGMLIGVGSLFLLAQAGNLISDDKGQGRGNFDKF
jgi:hypothetical protein